MINYLQPGRNLLTRAMVFLWCWMLVGMGVPIMANPTGGDVVGGAAGIASSGNTLTVTQTTDRTVINWQSFSIGSGELTQFLQPSASSIALNRVVGANMSEIYGTLSANGKVYLINPNGVLIGASGVINTAGFVASTLDVKNSEFMAGGDIQFSGNSTAAVQNLGHIGVDNGDVFLIARQVENHGTIDAPNGEVGLAGGTEILLKSTGSDKLMILPASGSGSVNNSTTGQIRAAMVSLKAAGGNEYALAVNNGGLIRATGTSKINGKVMLIANSGETKNTGTIKARNVDGTGGTIETSGEKLTITGTIDAGAGGFWLIDPSDITIGDGTSGTLDATTIVAALDGGSNVSESANSMLYVNAALTWTGTGSLTLSAVNGIEINQAITATNGGLIISTWGTATCKADIYVNSFTLDSGKWRQVASEMGLSALPGFYAKHFTIPAITHSYADGNEFLRVVGGDGSSSNPYQIADIYGLQGLNSSSLRLFSSNFILANDIDASVTQYWNSGAGFDSLGDVQTAFSGSLDGKGYTISGLTINRSTTDFVGLFQFFSGVLSNLNLTNVSVSGARWTGGLIGRAESGTVQNCYVTGTVSGANCVGGLVGYVDSLVLSHSGATVTVTGASYVGGLVGIGTVTIDSCWADGFVSGSGNVGGLVGQSMGTTTNSHATATVTGTGDYVGGLIGTQYGGSISYSYATGTVSSTGNFVGGLVGYSPLGTIQKSYATGSVQGQNEVGGLVGYQTNGAINSCYATGAVSGYMNVGGLMGENWGSVSDVYATGSVTGNSIVGGLVGWNASSSTISNAYAVGLVTTSTSFYVGGFAGANYGVIKNSVFATDGTGQSVSVSGGTGSNGVTGRTLAQMKVQSNYASSWNFNLPTGNNSTLVTSGVWGIDDAGVVNGGLPVFQWQHPIVVISAMDQTVPYGTGASTVPTLGTTYTIAGLVGADTVSSALSTVSLSVTGTNVNVGTTNSIVISGSTNGTTYLLKKVNGTEAFSQIDLIIDMPLAAIIVSSLSSTNVTYDINYKSIYVNADVTWDSGNTLTLDAANNIQISNAITANNGSLVLKAVNAVTADGAISVKNFTLAGGSWSQVSAALPSFSAQNFTISSNSTFLRVQGGDGSSTTPYQIADVYGLQGISYGLTSKSFILTHDIDASTTSGWNSGAGFVMIGSASSSFNGTFDGNGYTIRNLVINLPTTDFVGLFSYVNSAGAIKNVTLANASVTGASYVGGLIGYSEGSVMNCSGTVTVSSTKSGAYAVGGLVGMNAGAISQSGVTGTVTGLNAQGVGGLVGANSGTINQSYANVTVKGNETVGGLVGENYGIISESFATGSIYSNDMGGGFVGYNAGSISISYATGAVRAVTGGGFVGYDDGGSYSENYFATDGTGLTQSEGTGASISGITGMTLVQMKDQANYSSAWNYTLPTGNNGTRSVTGTWVIDDSGAINNGLPVFQWKYSVLAVTALDQSVPFGSSANTTATLGTTYTIAGLIGTDTVSTVLSDVQLAISGTNVDAGTTNSIVISATQNGTSYILKKVSGTETFERIDLTIDSALASLIMGTLSSTNVSFNSVNYNDIYVKADVTWDSVYTLMLDAYNNLQISNAITANNGSLVVSAGNTITANGAISVKNFTLAGGNWSQVAALLPGFSAQNFVLTNSSTFLRVQGGDGSSATPYRIADVYGLQGIASPSKTLLSKNYVLVNNVDASVTSGWNNGEGFVSIGSDSDPFTGAFDGNSYTISGLFINRPSTDYVGMFGYLSNSASVLNIILADLNVTGGNYTGGLAGYNGGTVSGSIVTGTVSGTSYVGGLIGSNEGTISYSSAQGTVTGTNATNLGGLAGYNTGTIERSSANVTVNGMDSVGGLVGENDNIILESYAVGSVTGTGVAGGLVGINAGSISRSYATNSVNGFYVGGLVGYNVGSINISYASGTVIVAGGGMSGGLVGYSSGGTYADNYFATDGTGQTQGVGYSKTSVTGVTARTLAQMLDQSNYSSAWNFTLPTGNNGTLVTNGIWATDDSKTVNQGLPVFQWEHPILLLTAADQSVVYGTTINTSAILGTTYTVAGLKGTDTVSSILSGSGLSVSGSNVNVGTTNSIVISTTQVGATYILKKVTGTESFTPASLTITATDQSKTYGQTLLLGTTSFTTSGLVTANGDSVTGVTLTSAGAASTADAGVYTISASSAVGSGLSNYTISYVYAPTGLTVNKAALTITATDQSKTYGQTLLLGTTSFTTSGLVTANGDSVTGVTLTSAGAVSTADHGVYTISASSAVGNRLDNYDITYAYAPTGLTVNKAALTIAATDQSKTYGETLLLGTTSFTTSGLVTANGDSVTGVTLTSAGAASTADHGVYTISASSAVGNRLDNYTISYAYAPTGLTVNKAALTITATDQSKTYGQTLLLGTTSFTTSGLVTANGDSVTGVTLTSAGAASTADHGVYTISASSAVGNRLDNYTISYAYAPTGLTVNKAALTITATDQSKTYGQTLLLGTTAYTTSGLVTANGDSVTGVTLTSAGAVNTANAGVYALSASDAVGNRLDNYTITYVDAATGLTVNPASITVTALGGTSIYGSSPTNPGLTASGLVNGESVSVLTGITNSFGVMPTTDVNTYTLTVAGTSTNTNYTITATYNGSWVVTPAAITVEALGGRSAYGTNPANPGLSAIGLQNGQDTSVLTGLTNSFGIVSTTGIGSYTLTVAGTLTNHNYTISSRNDGNWSVYFDPATSGTQQDSNLFLADLLNNSGTKGKSSGSVPRPLSRQTPGMMTGGAPTEGSLYILSTAMLEQAQGNTRAR